MLFSTLYKKDVTKMNLSPLYKSFHPPQYIERNEKLPAVMIMKFIINFSISTLYGTLFSSEGMLIMTEFNEGLLANYRHFTVCVTIFIAISTNIYVDNSQSFNINVFSWK